MDGFSIFICVMGIAIPVVSVTLIIFFTCKRHHDFIAKKGKIKLGMTATEVLQIMNCSATTAEENGNILTAVWEQSQWKGIQHGGTLVRAIKVVFENGYVISVSGKNLDKSTFF